MSSSIKSVIEQEETQEGLVRNQETEMNNQVVKNDDESSSRDGGGESSPRGVLETTSSSGLSSWTDSEKTSSNNSISSSSSSPETLPVQEDGIFHRRRRTAMEALKIKSAAAARRLFFSIGMTTTKDDTVSISRSKKLARIRSAEGCSASVSVVDYQILPTTKPSWRSFDHPELAAATNNFSPENLIGKGGNAEVYRGRLADGQVVAVKRLIKKQNEEEKRIGDFLSELGIIAHVDHPNAAKLLGFGVDGGLHLVLEFSPHGSLASLLQGSTEVLEWKIRFKVAVGVAEGLEYLHHGCHRRIIHRDIKASNILLTQDYEAQISDFGLAKWLPAKWDQHVVFPIEGTFGYLAPEYFMHGIIDEKTDVFAFGVLLLEIITGRRAIDSCRQSLVMWAKPLLDANDLKELVDPRLGENFDPREMKNTVLAATMCIQYSSSMRPNMKNVLEMLWGQDKPVNLKQKSFSERTLILDGCDAEDYTNDTYLNDLNRHMQLAME